MSDREPPLEGSDQGYFGLKEEAEQITEESREQSEKDSATSGSSAENSGAGSDQRIGGEETGGRR